MIDEKHIDLVTAYIEGTITHEQSSKLNGLITSGEIDILEIKELEDIYHTMGRLPEPQPGDQMSRIFYQMLEHQKNKEKRSNNSPIFQTQKHWYHSLLSLVQPKQLAIALGIFVAGMVIGNWTTPFQDYRNQLNRLSVEVSQMREVMMLTLLDNDSVTERLIAVNVSKEMLPADKNVADALLKTLQNDPNINVRLAAIEALVYHASQPGVREGLVNAISTQKSPVIQAALADAMLVLRERRSIEKFKEVLDQNDLDSSLRDKLQQTVTALSEEVTI